MASLRQLRALMLIGQTGSFTRAADQMAVTQSAVSILIRELEAEMGTQLVQRGRETRLTDSGHRLERAARRASHEIEQARREIREQRDQAQVVIRLAVGSLSAATFVPRAIAALTRSSEARIRVEILDGPMTQLADLLISGDADVGIGSIDSPIRRSATLKNELLSSDTLCAVAASSSPYGVLLRKKGIDWPALASVPLILVGCRGGQWQQLLLKRVTGQDQAYQVQEVQLFSTALAMVREGLGVGVLPSSATRQLGADFKLRAIGDTEERWNTYWVTRRESSVPDAAMAQLKSAIVASMEQ